MRWLLVAAPLLVVGAGAGHAQKVYVPPTPPAPPAVPTPVVPLPAAPSLPAAPAPTVPLGTPVLPAAPAARLPQAAAAPQPPTQVVPPCRRPGDCPDGSPQERARRKFAQCVDQARINSNSLDTRKLEDCALGFMAPSKLADFKRCLARRETAWECFRQAYLN